LPQRTPLDYDPARVRPRRRRRSFSCSRVGCMYRYASSISSRSTFAACGGGASLGTPRWTAAAGSADGS